MNTYTGRQFYLITNFASLYTFVIEQNFKQTPDVIVSEIRQKLQSALRGTNMGIQWEPSDIIPVKGNPRVVVGSMNEMIRMLGHRTQGEGMNVAEELQKYINRAIFLSLPGYPKDKWIELLQQVNTARS